MIEISEYEMNFDMQEPTLALVARGLFTEFDVDSNGHLDLNEMEAVYNRMDLNSQLPKIHHHLCVCLFIVWLLSCLLARSLLVSVSS